MHIKTVYTTQGFVSLNIHRTTMDGDDNESQPHLVCHLEDVFAYIINIDNAYWTTTQIYIAFHSLIMKDNIWNFF